MAERFAEASTPPFGEGYEQLLCKKRERGLAPLPSEGPTRATITVRRAGWPRWLGVRTGLVVIDQKRGGVLLGGRPRSFTVPPGEHLVTVRIGGNMATAGALRLQAGDRIDLVCGRGEPAPRSRWAWPFVLWRWSKRRLATFGYCLGAYLFGTLGLVWLPRFQWLIFDWLQLHLFPANWTGVFDLLRSLPYLAAPVGALLGIALWAFLVPARWAAPAEPPYLARQSGPAEPTENSAPPERVLREVRS